MWKANQENIQPSTDSDISPEIGGIGSKKASKQSLRETNKSLNPVDKGFNEVFASCFTEIRHKARSKERLMEQFFTNAFQSSNAKLAHCSKQTDGLKELQKSSMRSQKKRRDATFNDLAGIKNNVDTIQQLTKTHQTLELEVASQVSSFQNRSELLLEVLHKRDEAEKQEAQKTNGKTGVFKMQQELQNEIAEMEINLVEKEMKLGYNSLNQ